MKPSTYQIRAEAAINDPLLQAALANLQQRLGRGAADGYRRFPEGPELRLKGHDIRMKAIDNLEELDDVQNIYSNLEISDEAVQAMEGD